MPLIIYGFRPSHCTRRVAVICKELNVPYEIVDVILAKGEQKSPENLARQPFGVVPAIDDNGFQLFESRAICRYLVAKYGRNQEHPLIPSAGDVEALAKFEQAASIESSYFEGSASQLALETVLKPSRGLATDKERVKTLSETLGSKLDAYEVILSKQPYLAGEHVTLADLFHLPYGWTITEKGGIDVLLTRPNVARWWKSISSRESWQAVKNGA